MSLRVLPALILPAALSIGCTSTKEDTGSSAPPINGGDDTAVVACDGTAPVLTELVVGNGGIRTYEDHDSPSMTVSATATDADSDLHRMDMKVWWDDVVDGVVDTTAAGTAAGYYTFDPDPCATPEATYGIAFEVEGSRFGFGLPYEFAAEVYDAEGLVSAQVIAHGVSPNEDGTDG